MCCGYPINTPINKKASKELKEISVERTYHVEFDVTLKSSGSIEWTVLDDIDDKQADFVRYIYNLVETTFQSYINGKVSMKPQSEFEHREYYA